MNYIFSATMLGIATTIAQAGFQSPGAPLQMDAQVTCTDGTSQIIYKVNINATSEFITYAKPTKIKSQTASEIMVESNPRDNSTNQTLNTIKSITFKNKQTAYVYQDKEGMKHKFHEIDIDGSSFLIPAGWKLHGKDTNNKDRSVSFDIIEKITITSVYTKAEPVGDQYICPISK